MEKESALVWEYGVNKENKKKPAQCFSNTDTAVCPNYQKKCLITMKGKEELLKQTW